MRPSWHCRRPDRLACLEEAAVDREEEAAKHFTAFAHTERTTVSVLLNGEGQRDYAAWRSYQGGGPPARLAAGAAGAAAVGQQKQEQDGQGPAKRAKR